MNKAKKGGPTPMMVQYLGIKAENPGSILLFRMGDFYETFYEDAEIVARVLGITLTSREKKGGNPIPLAGVPFHSLENHLVKLLDAGCTVAICEQVEDPAQAKGLVRREVVETLSPGTVTNPALLRDDDSSYLLSVVASDDGSHCGYAVLDGATGEFRCGELDSDAASGLARRFRIGEFITPDGETLPRSVEASLADTSRGPASAILFELEYSSRCLCDHFGVLGVSGLGLGELGLATRAAGACLRYLSDRQRARPAQVDTLRVEYDDDHMHLDRETIGHLELFEGLRAGQRETTLLRHLDETRSPMGRRCLTHWMRAPLCDRAQIEERHDAVQWMVDDITARDALRTALRGIGDLERIASRVATERAMPGELGQLRNGLARLPELATAIVESDFAVAARLKSSVEQVRQVQQRLDMALGDELPSHLRVGGVFRDGFDEQLDELRSMSAGGKQWIAAYQQSERDRTGIPNLKVGYNKVFGYHLEVTNAHLAKVPDDYDEKQKLTSAKRYVTPQLNERERDILRADDDRIAREEELYHEFVRTLVSSVGSLLAVARAVAEVDVLASLAHIAASRNYVRPRLRDDRVVKIEGGRHPVVERLVDEAFVPNDLFLDGATRQILLLTGPNMGGKSTYLRQTALFVVLAQMGSFVPADSAEIGIVDRLFTRVGASDDLARGQSTFLVEMSETANILRNATDRSLVILDEVGRGTSTDDGLALAWAITEYLHDGTQRPNTLFATHFHELTDLADSLEKAANIQMLVREHEGQILFLHTVVSGASDRSYGVHVAELAGVPEPVLRRARQLLDAPKSSSSNGSVPPPPERIANPAQLGLFSDAERLALDRIRKLEPDAMRPLDALSLLSELREGLGEA